MIIGIDATRANKPQKTGVEWYSFFLIKEMPKLDPDITFRLYFNSAPEPGLQNLGPNVEYRRLSWPFKYLWTQIRLSLEMLFNPPDVLFIPASIIPVISPKRTVTTLHDVAYEVYKGDLSWKGRAYQRLSAKWAKKICSQIITVSQFSKNEIIKYYQVAADKIQVTYLGLSHPEKIPPPPKQKKKYLLFVGRLESKKNIAQLIRVFAAIQKTSWGKHISLHLVGYPSRGWQEAENLIKQFRLENKIIRHGWIKEEEKYKLISEAAIYIHLAKYEGFGFGLIEAMACQTPIIANRAASLPEIAGSAALLVDANNIPEVVEAINKLYYDKKLQLDLIAKGLKRSQEFRWEKTAAQTLKILKNA